MPGPLSHSLFLSPPSLPILPHGGAHPLRISLPADLPIAVKEKILSLEIIGVDSERALLQNPKLRYASPDSIHCVVSYLRSKGIHHKDLARIFGMCPKVLTSSVATDLTPVFAFLSTDLHVPGPHFRRVINKCPRLLVSSVHDQLRPAFHYLQSLGFTDTDSLAFQDPILLVSSVEHTLTRKLNYLISVGYTRSDAVGMVRRCPGLFTFSVENNFEPKLAYLVGGMGMGLEELKEFPQYFAFSLEKRIKPRFRCVKERGVEMSLAVMLKTTDEEFKELLGVY